MHARRVRVVGTNALRIARRKQAFLERARDALGSPDRNRLRHGGGAPDLLGRGAQPADEPGRRLVIDIGGGSTEIIIGEGYEPLTARQPADRLRVAEPAPFRARIACRPSASSARGWPRGSSSSRCRPRSCSVAGSERSAAPVPCARSATVSAGANPPTTGITRGGPRETADASSTSVGDCRELDLDSLTEERRPVFPGGVVILAEIIEALDIEQMRMPKARCAMACCTTWSAA